MAFWGLGNGTHFGSFPNRTRIFSILFYNWKNVGCDDAVCLAEVVVDFCQVVN
jgi:hypothetical protein